MASAGSSGAGGISPLVPIVLTLAFIVGGAAEPLAVVAAVRRRTLAGVACRLERPG
jgi:hypothetical protein